MFPSKFLFEKNQPAAPPTKNYFSYHKLYLQFIFIINKYFFFTIHLSVTIVYNYFFCWLPTVGNKATVRMIRKKLKTVQAKPCRKFKTQISIT